MDTIEQELIKRKLLVEIHTQDIENYTLLNDCYFGSGGFYSKNYLIKSPREKTKDYENRKKIANYRNIFAPVVDSLNDPIFSHKVARSSEGNDTIYKEFIADADTAGASLTNVIQEIDLKAEILGCVFCFMDNFDSDVDTELEALNDRAFPYVFYIEPQNIKSYAFDELGRLIFLKYQNVTSTQGLMNFGVSEIEITYRSYYIKNGVWYTCQTDGVGNLTGEEVETSAPFMYSTTKKWNKQRLPLSRHLDTATTSIAIYNQNSLINQQQFTNTFNTLVMYGEKGNINLEVDSTLFIPEGNEAPFYLSPDVATGESIAKDRTEVQNEVMKVNNLSIQSSGSQQSAESKRWNDKKRQEKLSKKVSGIMDLERWVSNSFSFYFEGDLTSNVIYNETFDFFTVSEDLEDIIKMEEAGFSQETQNKARAMFITKFFNQLNSSEVDEYENAEINNEKVIETNIELD